MMKNKRGFTLIELLAVIVVLAIILTIATTSVIKNINDSKEKAKYIAAKEIVDISDAYFVSETDGIQNYNNGTKCIMVKYLMDKGYLDKDVTNPRTGENTWSEYDKQSIICYIPNELSSKTKDYKPLQGAESRIKNSWAYYFDYYYYRYWTEDDPSDECIDDYKYSNGKCIK